MGQHHLETRSLQTIDQPVPVEGALDHDLQIVFVGLEQLADSRQLIAQLLLHHKPSVVRRSHTRDNLLHSNRFRSRTSSEVASFLAKGLVKQTQFTAFAFGRLY